MNDAGGEDYDPKLDSQAIFGHSLAMTKNQSLPAYPKKYLKSVSALGPSLEQDALVEADDGTSQQPFDLASARSSTADDVQDTRHSAVVAGSQEVAAAGDQGAPQTKTRRRNRKKGKGGALDHQEAMN